MTAVLLTIHSIIVLALIGVVLLQRSDGGALGIGGGGGGGGFMTGRGAANALTRTTSVLAALFFATSLTLAVRAGGGENTDTVIDELTGTQSAPVQTQQLGDDEAPSATDLLNSLGGAEDAETADSDEATSAAELIEALGAEAPPAPAESQDETPSEDAAEEPAAADEAPQSENETPDQ